jgi:cyclophilin family peptidyl-prolyl cis-trans isomerase
MQNPIATFNTSHGTFSAEVYLFDQPVTASNFISLANSGFYDGVHFHRVVQGFSVQVSSAFRLCRN